jgi:catechol 2,3-dioxygenase-like lactoylglutathione lyase family enzyme
MGTKFFEPLTDISDIGGNVGAKDLFYYAYVEGPDHALIELNTARHHHFGHLHLFSDDPVSAAEWYDKHFGIRLSPSLKNPKAREPHLYRGFQIGPNASFMIDDVNVIIFPVQMSKKAYADHWKGRTALDSTRGRAIDHVALSVDNLAETLARLKSEGVKVTDETRPIPGTKIKSAFIEGPDRISLELVEGHAGKE